jgi:hypothetical protein
MSCALNYFYFSLLFDRYKQKFIFWNWQIQKVNNRISGVMKSVFASITVDHGFEPIVKWATFYLYHGENKLIFNEMKMRSALY